MMCRLAFQIVIGFGTLHLTRHASIHIPASNRIYPNHAPILSIASAMSGVVPAKEKRIH
jgi:hypothetical protein